MGKTIAQKIFDAHMVDRPFEGTNILKLDRVFCHEITTPIAINDLVDRKMDRVFDSTKIKAVIDHVSPAKDSTTFCASAKKLTSNPEEASFHIYRCPCRRCGNTNRNCVRQSSRKRVLSVRDLR